MLFLQPDAVPNWKGGVINKLKNLIWITHRDETVFNQVETKIFILWRFINCNLKGCVILLLGNAEAQHSKICIQ